MSAVTESDKKQNVVYIYDKNLCANCDRLPQLKNRASIVHDLIESYGLLNFLTIIESQNATEDDLKLCHSSTYVEFIKSLNDQDEEDLECSEDDEDEYGLVYDCPMLEKMFDFSKTIAGGSLTAAKQLMDEKCNVAINWFGGWHHAQRGSAEGFCYINDVAIAIQKLTEKYKRVLYIDFDIHHGNGVQNLFEISQKVVTLSFHKFMPGFYPGSGSITDVGYLKGKYYSLNIPFLEGVGDYSLFYVFSVVFPCVFKAFKPHAIVVQCGADGICGDPLGESNLTPKTYGACVQNILDKNIPTLFLGGGGYNFANTARLWTYLTSLILKKKLDNDIPDEAEYFSEYVPDYELKISSGNRRDNNSKEYLDNVIETIVGYCKKIQIND